MSPATADPARVAEAAKLYPHTRIVPTPEALFALAADLDLVVLGTPPVTHFDLAATAIAHGLHVVVDKPFVTSAAHGAELIALAADAGVQLTVQVVEPTGSETQVHGRVGDVAVLGAFRERVAAQPGEPLTVTADPALVHLFDRDTGQRLVA